MTVHSPPSPDALLADLRMLVDVESPSDDLIAVARSAETVAALGTRLLGQEPTRRTVDGVTQLEWSFGERASVLLLGHHDTVWPIGSWDPLWSSDGARVAAPGAFDMKAGLVQIFHAVAGLTDRDGVRILITGDEEIGSTTSRERISTLAEQTGVALVTEASAPGGALKTERSGVAHYLLEIHGRAAHAGLEPEKGVNATVEIAHQILALDRIAQNVDGATVTPTLMSSGDSANTVPAFARLFIDVRSTTARAFDAVDAAIGGLGPVLPESRVVVTRRFASSPLEAASSAALFELAVAVAGELGLPPLTKAAVGGGSDGNIAAAAGALVLDGLGAVGGGAHARDEHVLVAELAPRVLLLRGMVAAILDGRLGDRARA
jgi:glutamate carboxypeptidase